MTAFEFFSDKALAKILARGDVPAPFESECPFYALLEFEASTEEVANEALAASKYCVERGWVVDGVMSQSQQQLENLWKLREYISETISHWTPYKNDISVTVAQVPAFLHDIDAIVEANYPDFEVVWFGHIGDGNLHLNILKPENLSKDEFFAKCATVNQWVFETVQKYNGSISAEHGVGMTKRDYLGYSRSAEKSRLYEGDQGGVRPEWDHEPRQNLSFVIRRVGKRPQVFSTTTTIRWKTLRGFPSYDFSVCRMG